MNFRVPQNAGNLPSGCTTCGLLSVAQLHRVSCESVQKGADFLSVIEV
jgi:hypothetical protein